MDFFTSLTIIVHSLAIIVLVSTMPRQLQDIWSEEDARYRKICWVVFIGTFCLTAMNVLPLLQILFYQNTMERFFWNLTNMFQGVIGISLGVLAHIMFSSNKVAFPRVIDDIDTYKKNEKS